MNCVDANFDIFRVNIKVHILCTSLSGGSLRRHHRCENGKEEEETEKGKEETERKRQQERGVLKLKGKKGVESGCGGLVLLALLSSCCSGTEKKERKVVFFLFGTC